MVMNYVIPIAIGLVLLLAYNFADDVRLSANQWVDTQLNGETYCPTGSIESVKWAVEVNGVGLEHTKTENGQFCFQTKDKALADKIIKEAKDRELELNKLREQENGKTQRTFLIVGGIILFLLIIWLISNR